jgi:hypothetical protein
VIEQCDRFFKRFRRVVIVPAGFDDAFQLIVRAAGKRTHLKTDARDPAVINAEI